MAATWIVEAVDVFKDGHLSRTACLTSMSPDEFSLALHGRVLLANHERGEVVLLFSGVVAWTLTPLISVVACLLEDAINAAQIQR